MTDANWVQAEYEALREEILSLTDAQQSAIRFLLPAAAIVYAVPYLVNRTTQTILWIFCAGGSGLMVMAMSYAALSYVEGVWKIGTYIRTAIESKLDNGPRWETFLFETQTRHPALWPSEHVVICLGAVAANVGAALGTGWVFLHCCPKQIVTRSAGDEESGSCEG